MIRENPPVLFRAACVLTLDGPETEAFAVDGDRIRAVGDLAALRSRFPGAREVDLGAATVVPGLHDAHVHLVHAAEELLRLDLSAAAVSGVEDLLGRVGAETRTTEAGTWIRGGRYDDAKTGPLTRWDLDRAAPDHPVLVVQVAGHWGVANSRALRELGIDESSPPPAGGEYGRSPDGRLDGRLIERALLNVAYRGTARGGAVLPAASPEERLRGLERVVRRWHAAGLTSICDALVAPPDVELLRRARDRGLLTLRVGMLLSFDHYDRARALGVGSGFGDDFLRFVGVKAFADGAVGGRTCLLSEPYADGGGHGMQTTSTEDLFEAVATVHRGGDRIGVHANGDAAIRLVLDAFAAARRDFPRPGLRHRIEHCSVVDEDILARMRDLDAVAVPFAGYVAYHGDALNHWYGPSRTERMFAHRSFLDAGVTVAGSSDHPCGPYEPLVGVQSMVTREGLDDGAPVGVSQRVSVEEALRVYTIGSAEAEGVASTRGRLAPGYAADFVVLGENPLTADPHGIASIPVHATYVAGRRVHGGV
ncbi:amidohydrolase [Actinoallomurus iriomotensis]|uniref:Amidohydrolase n=1 Tax=Actinoallomurus iriomotensis TaxID=478107 RepID=A0A9W6RP79_9ACTN|nr:amidohydrolase [Actinoallomurus iriomotensis]GLY77425.1 amidohydrolase [Actinoallomurus iriomotensis]